MSYPSAVATSGAAQTTRPSPATGAIASSTSAISSWLAPAPIARAALQCRQTPGDPVATDAASCTSAAVLGSRTEVPARPSPSPAWSSTNPSSIIASRRKVSWNLAIWPSASVSPDHHSTSGQDELHHSDGTKNGPSPFQEPQLTRPRDGLVP